MSDAPRVPETDEIEACISFAYERGFMRYYGLTSHGARNQLTALRARAEQAEADLAWQVFLVDHFRGQLRSVSEAAHAAMEVEPARNEWAARRDG